MQTHRQHLLRNSFIAQSGSENWQFYSPILSASGTGIWQISSPLNITPAVKILLALCGCLRAAGLQPQPRSSFSFPTVLSGMSLYPTLDQMSPLNSSLSFNTHTLVLLHPGGWRHSGHIRWDTWLHPHLLLCFFSFKANGKKKRWRGKKANALF